MRKSTEIESIHCSLSFCLSLFLGLSLRRETGVITCKIVQCYDIVLFDNIVRVKI